MDESKGRGGWSGLLVVVATLFIGAAVSAWGLHFPANFGVDDALITQVYARNIAEGHGYVYVAGGERVEGSTSLLWTLLCAALFKLSAAPQPALLSMTMVFTGLAIGAAVMMARLWSPVAEWRPVAWIAGLLLVSLDLNFFAWSVWSLMDTALYVAIAAWMTVAAMALPDRPDTLRIAGATALFGLAPVVRPEGIGLAAGLSIAMTVICLASRKRKSAAAFTGCAIAATATFGAATWFRLVYFGWPLPNTYYAKVADDHVAVALQGLRYLVKSLWQMPLLGPALLLAILAGWQIAAAWWQARSPRDLEPRLAMLLAMAGLVSGAVLEGGDHFNGARQLQAVAPMAAALVGVFLWSKVKTLDWSSTAPRLGAAMCAAIAVIGARACYVKAGTSLQIEFDVGTRAMAVGESMTALSGYYGPPSIAVIPAGGTAYAYRGKVLDMVGLNWVAMAHANGDKSGPIGHAGFHRDILLQAHPDFVDLFDLHSAGKPAISRWIVRVTKDLARDAEFRRSYSPAKILFPGGAVSVAVSQEWLKGHPGAPVRLYHWDEVEIASL